MIRILKWILIALCMVTIVSGTTTFAMAKDLPTGFLIGDHDGIQVTRDGTYFIDARGLTPGDVITKKLTIRNTERDLPYKLTMSAEPLEVSGPIDLLKSIDLQIKLDGVVIYEGIVQGDAGVDMVNNALELGTYSYGDSKTMDILLKVHDDMPLYNEKSEAEIRWDFYAVKDTTADPPKTGENLITLICMILLFSINAASIIFLIINKKRELGLKK